MTPDLPPPKCRVRILRRVALVLVLLLAAGGMATWIVGGSLVAPRSQHIGAPPDDFPALTISLESESGSTLSGWHFRAEKSHGVIVLLHGIGGSRKSMLGRARFLMRHGYSIVMVDLQAHGESSGNKVTLGYRESCDACAAVQFARDNHPGEPVGLIGVSLGGASALFASPLPIDALIIESVYPDIRRAVHNRVAARIGPIARVPAELLLVQLKPRLGISESDLRPIARLHNVGCPVFVISGSEDDHTTAEETREMFDAALDPKELWLVEGAGHVNLHEVSVDEYERRVLAFLAVHFSGPRQ